MCSIMLFLEFFLCLVLIFDNLTIICLGVDFFYSNALQATASFLSSGYLYLSEDLERFQFILFN